MTVEELLQLMRENSQTHKIRKRLEYLYENDMQAFNIIVAFYRAIKNDL